MTFILSLFLIISLTAFWQSYQLFRHQRTRWIKLTRLGIKLKTNEYESQSKAFWNGVLSLIFGLFFFYLSVKGLYQLFS